LEIENLDCKKNSDSWAIGGIPLTNPLVLAPMAGITQLPMRRLAKDQGCALVVSEMISSNGIVYGGQKTLELLKSHPSERPLSVQIFGKDPEIMKEAALIIQGQGADLLDINLGCSVRKVVKQGAGAALMREPHRLASIIKAVREAVSMPLTVKIRSGWDPSGDQAVDIGRMAQDLGIDAVAIHPRTALQGFAGKADWSLITRLKKSLSIPVVGNGDVTKPEEVLKMREETGCDAVMIGRAAMGNPWIFSQALDLLNGRCANDPDLLTRLDTICRYIRYAIDQFGEIRAVRMMRSRLAWFVKGLPRCSRFRKSIVRLQSQEEMIGAVKAYFEALQEADFSTPPPTA
jgi:nifR3 family TIM-barrel protein